MDIRLTFFLVGGIAASAVVFGVPATAAPLVSDVSSTTLPPSDPGRLASSRAVLVGRLSSAVATSLRVAGLDVVRVGNTSAPYGVGAAVASHLVSHRALVVPVKIGESAGWRLPLASAGFAAYKHRPLLFARPASLPAPTRRAIQTGGITSVTVVGGDKRVSPELLRQLEGLGVAVHRIASSDPYAISALFADRTVTAGAETDHPIVSSGSNWKSSVTAPALAALLGQVSLLVDSRDLTASRPTAIWLSQHRTGITTVKLLGGAGLVRPMVEVQLEHRVRS